MDIALYLVAAAVLIVLIVFALKVRRKTQEGEELKSQLMLTVSIVYHSGFNVKAVCSTLGI